MKVKVILTALLLCSISSAMSAEKILATIYRTSDKVKSELVLNTDDKVDIIKVVFKIYSEEGDLAREVNVTPEELPEGKTILTKMSLNVIELQSDNVASHNGGDVTIKYLKKFKLLGKNKYGSFNVVLDREGDDWVLKKDGRIFTELLAHTHSKGINKFTIIK
jgi:hypothetical protein